MLFVSPPEQSEMQKSLVGVQKFTQISSPLPPFSKSIKWVFEVYWKFLEFHQAGTKKCMYVSKCIEYMYQEFLPKITAMSGRFYGLVGLFLEKCSLDVSYSSLNMVETPF